MSTIASNCVEIEYLGNR